MPAYHTEKKEKKEKRKQHQKKKKRREEKAKVSAMWRCLCCLPLALSSFFLSARAFSGCFGGELTLVGPAAISSPFPSLCNAASLHFVFDWSFTFLSVLVSELVEDVCGIETAVVCNLSGDHFECLCVRIYNQLLLAGN